MADGSKKSKKKVTKKKTTKKKVVAAVPATPELQPRAAIASLAHWAFILTPLPALILIPVLYFTVGKEDNFVRANAVEALNLLILIIICGVTFGILALLCIGIPLLIALEIYVLIFSIVAAIKTMGSTMDTPVYRYPINIRLIK